MTEEQNEESRETEEKDELTTVLEDSQGKEDEEGGESKEEGEGEKGEEKEDGETEGTEEKAGEKEEGKVEDKELDHIKALQEEVKDLRQMVRTSKRELTQTQAKLERVSERSVKAEARDEDEDEDEEKKGKGKEESLSTVEELQGAIANVGTLKGAALDILLETMEQNSKYEDIQEVCSRGNFDDIFEVIATEATKGGGNFDETLLEVELNVWNKSNPYKYMYDLIKKYHPSYAKKEGVAAPGGKEKKGGKPPEKTKAPGTIADKGGDGNLKGGWTAKRIDDLPEDELHMVPKEIYARYMKDDLD